MAVYDASAFGALAYRNAGISGAPIPNAFAALNISSIYGGPGTIRGITQAQTGTATFIRIPFARVLIHDQRNGQFVREVESDAAGDYAVPNVRADIHYYAVALDPSGTYDAAVTRSLKVDL